MFATAIHHPSLIPEGFYDESRLRALPENIRLGLKCLTVTSALAYYGKELITAVKNYDTCLWCQYYQNLQN